MAKPSRKVWLPFLERAAESEVGIAINTNEPKALRDELLTLRREEANPAFDDLITFIPATNTEVFICRKTVDMNE